MKLLQIFRMSFASANGWAGPPFLILHGVRQKAIFNAQAKKYFSGSEVATKKGFMTEVSFAKWAEFFVEEIKCVRGNLDHWTILVLDGHHSHTYSLEALQILTDNNIFVVG